jgi:hypothetical protein
VTQPTGANRDRTIAAVFDDALAFRRAAISVLAEHGIVSDHFGGRIPAATEMADRPDTPREDLDSEGALSAAIHFIAESISTIGAVGAAGLAYAVGGPVGIAATAADKAEAGIEDLLSRNVGEAMIRRYEESVRDGGIVCWVHTRNTAEAKMATAILTAQGGGHVHAVKTTFPPGTRTEDS